MNHSTPTQHLTPLNPDKEALLQDTSNYVQLQHPNGRILPIIRTEREVIRLLLRAGYRQVTR
jgi:hypothetical protein